MSSEIEFYAEMQPQIAQVIGVAVMQLLLDQIAVSRQSIITIILAQTQLQDSDVDVAVEMALDVLIYPGE
ncbi:hypothetical protein MUA04_22005 [Enterobacteriaceae bacterium H11S18]|uniref:hypothetical protein n=1 Tax=Dryocola clanedunensis TaxID=2925396 RepID=UPI0022F08377|nr:hypothetical protein [Dryocola clanedunensis]MCT4712844.1 hypothetical protein [Dryocola clanedunensis]